MRKTIFTFVLICFLFSAFAYPQTAKVSDGVSYQWKKVGQNVEGSTNGSATFTINNNVSGEKSASTVTKQAVFLSNVYNDLRSKELKRQCSQNIREELKVASNISKYSKYSSQQIAVMNQHLLKAEKIFAGSVAAIEWPKPGTEEWCTEFTTALREILSKKTSLSGEEKLYAELLLITFTPSYTNFAGVIAFHAYLPSSQILPYSEESKVFNISNPLMSVNVLRMLSMNPSVQGEQALYNYIKSLGEFEKKSMWNANTPDYEEKAQLATYFLFNRIYMFGYNEDSFKRIRLLISDIFGGSVEQGFFGRIKKQYPVCTSVASLMLRLIDEFIKIKNPFKEGTADYTKFTEFKNDALSLKKTWFYKDTDMFFEDIQGSVVWSALRDNALLLSSLFIFTEVVLASETKEALMTEQGARYSLVRERVAWGENGITNDTKLIASRFIDPESGMGLPRTSSPIIKTAPKPNISPVNPYSDGGGTDVITKTRTNVRTQKVKPLAPVDGPVTKGNIIHNSVNLQPVQNTNSMIMPSVTPPQVDDPKENAKRKPGIGIPRLSTKKQIQITSDNSDDEQALNINPSQMEHVIEGVVYVKDGSFWKQKDTISNKRYNFVNGKMEEIYNVKNSIDHEQLPEVVEYKGNYYYLDHKTRRYFKQGDTDKKNAYLVNWHTGEATQDKDYMPETTLNDPKELYNEDIFLATEAKKDYPIEKFESMLDAGVLEGKKILVVDDEIGKLGEVVSKLIYANAEVYPATNLLQAKEKINSIKFDLIYVDLRLFDGSSEQGNDIIGFIRSKDKNIPVIAMSGNLFSNNNYLWSIGFSGSLEKPSLTSIRFIYSTIIYLNAKNRFYENKDKEPVRTPIINNSNPRKHTLHIKTETGAIRTYGTSNRTFQDIADIYGQYLFPNITDAAQRSAMFLEFLKGKKILDVGSGLSNFVETLRKNNIDAYGLDISLPQEARSKDYFFEASANDTKLAETSFDLIFCTYSVFYYEPEDKKMVKSTLQELIRILKAGGALYYTTHYEAPNFVIKKPDYISKDNKILFFPERDDLYINHKDIYQNGDVPVVEVKKLAAPQNTTLADIYEQYSKYTTKDLYIKLQEDLDWYNKSKGYLPGLDPDFNATDAKELLLDPDGKMRMVWGTAAGAVQVFNTCSDLPEIVKGVHLAFVLSELYKREHPEKYNDVVVPWLTKEGFKADNVDIKY